MIRVTLEPVQIAVNQINSLVIRLTNTGHKPCTHVVLRLKLPMHIVLLEGSDRIEADQIDANQSLAHMIRIRPRQVGTWTLTTTNFSYRDAQDQPQYPDPLLLEVIVTPAMPKQENPVVAAPLSNHQMLSGKTLQARQEAKQPMINNSASQFQSELRKGIVKCFGISDLKVLCADLDIDYESLGGENKEAKTLELILYMSRRGQITKLLQYCISTRPGGYTWPKEGVSQQPATQIHEGLTVNAGIVVLFLASDPTNASRLRLGEELREIQGTLQLAKLRDRVTLQQRMSVRPADISQALLDMQPQVVHFSGHGAASGELCFENVLGETHPVGPDALAALFEQFSDQVNCVVLNACFSEVQAKAIAQHISYVVGMNQAIGDRAAIAFAIGFYQALGAGRTIEDAYKLGCVQIRLQGIPEHLVPTLIKKRQIQ